MRDKYSSYGCSCSQLLEEFYMSYVRKPCITRLSGEPIREYVQRIIAEYPRGYSAYVYGLPEVQELMAGHPYDTNGEWLYNWLYPGSQPQCVNCGGAVKFQNFSSGYRQYCSCSCKAKHCESFKNGATQNAVDKRRVWRSALSVAVASDISTRQSVTKIQRYGTAGNPHAVEVGRAQKVRRYGEQVVAQLESYDYMYDLVVEKQLSSFTIGNMIGVSSDVVLQHARKLGIPFATVDRGTSKQEREIRSFLDGIGVPYETNVTTILPNRKEIDIYVPSAKLAIEYNGSYWHSPDNKLSKHTPSSHLEKSKACANIGVSLVHVFDSDWINKQGVVKSRILYKLGLCSITYARSCNVTTVDVPRARQFFTENHIQGWVNAKHILGLVSPDGELLACMTFGKPRYNSSYEWELLRFANKVNTTTVGGASKLFNHFVTAYTPSSIISYSDNAWGAGGMYSKLGMTQVAITSPSYWLVDPQDPLKRKFHRSAFMKHKLVQKGYDPQLTEHQITKSMGLYRVYDCGTTKWVWVANTHTM